MSRYLVDNSVLQRLPRSPAVQAAVGAVLEAEHELCSCTFTLDEFAYSVRSAAEHGEGTHRLRTAFLYLPASPDTDQIVIDIRTALWQASSMSPSPPPLSMPMPQSCTTTATSTTSPTSTLT